jgi:hypothetical protein
MIDQPLPCIVCGFQPKPVTGSGYQPLGALMFDAGSGHYGSGVWDTMNSWRSLAINVCDDCLTARRDRVAVVERTPPARPEVQFVQWDPQAIA